MTSSGIISFSEQYLKCRNKVSILVILIVLAALPISFVLLSFSGDIGYVDTLKAGEFLGEYFTSHADERFLVITQVKYYPQMTWYSNLTMNNRSNRELKLISDVFSMEDIAKAIANYNIQNVFIVTDTINFEMERSYKVVYKYEYRTELPDLVNALVHQKDSIDSKFGQDLSIYMVSGI